MGPIVVQSILLFSFYFRGEIQASVHNLLIICKIEMAQ